VENNIIPNNVSFEEVLRSHDFEFYKQENDDWVIRPKEKGISYFFDQFFLYGFILALLVIMFWSGGVLEFLFGVIFLIGGLVAFFKKRSVLSGKSIRISKEQLILEKENNGEDEIIKNEDIERLDFKIK
jgi:hypothetical protein